MKSMSRSPSPQRQYSLEGSYTHQNLQRWFRGQFTPQYLLTQHSSTFTHNGTTVKSPKRKLYRTRSIDSGMTLREWRRRYDVKDPHYLSNIFNNYPYPTEHSYCVGCSICGTGANQEAYSARDLSPMQLARFRALQSFQLERARSFETQIRKVRTFGYSDQGQEQLEFKSPVRQDEYHEIEFPQKAMLTPLRYEEWQLLKESPYQNGVAHEYVRDEERRIVSIRRWEYANGLHRSFTSRSRSPEKRAFLSEMISPEKPGFLQKETEGVQAPQSLVFSEDHPRQKQKILTKDRRQKPVRSGRVTRGSAERFPQGSEQMSSSQRSPESSAREIKLKKPKYSGYVAANQERPTSQRVPKRNKRLKKSIEQAQRALDILSGSEQGSVLGENSEAEDYRQILDAEQTGGISEWNAEGPNLTYPKAGQEQSGRAQGSGSGSGMQRRKDAPAKQQAPSDYVEFEGQGSGGLRGKKNVQTRGGKKGKGSGEEPRATARFGAPEQNIGGRQGRKPGKTSQERSNAPEEYEEFEGQGSGGLRGRKQGAVKSQHGEKPSAPKGQADVIQDRDSLLRKSGKQEQGQPQLPQSQYSTGQQIPKQGQLSGTEQGYEGPEEYVEFEGQGATGLRGKKKGAVRGGHIRPGAEEAGVGKPDIGQTVGSGLDQETGLRGKKQGAVSGEPSGPNIEGGRKGPVGQVEGQGTGELQQIGQPGASGRYSPSQQAASEVPPRFVPRYEDVGATQRPQEPPVFGGEGSQYNKPELKQGTGQNQEKERPAKYPYEAGQSPYEQPSFEGQKSTVAKPEGSQYVSPYSPSQSLPMETSFEKQQPYGHDESGRISPSDLSQSYRKPRYDTGKSEQSGQHPPSRSGRYSPGGRRITDQSGEEEPGNVRGDYQQEYRAGPSGKQRQDTGQSDLSGQRPPSRPGRYSPTEQIGGRRVTDQSGEEGTGDVQGAYEGLRSGSSGKPKYVKGQAGLSSYQRPGRTSPTEQIVARSATDQSAEEDSLEAGATYEYKGSGDDPRYLSGKQIEGLPQKSGSSGIYGHDPDYEESQATQKPYGAKGEPQGYEGARGKPYQTSSVLTEQPQDYHQIQGQTQEPQGIPTNPRQGGKPSYATEQSIGDQRGRQQDESKGQQALYKGQEGGTGRPEDLHEYPKAEPYQSGKPRYATEQSIGEQRGRQSEDSKGQQMLSKGQEGGRGDLEEIHEYPKAEPYKSGKPRYVTGSQEQGGKGVPAEYAASQQGIRGKAQQGSTRPEFISESPQYSDLEQTPQKRPPSSQETPYRSSLAGTPYSKTPIKTQGQAEYQSESDDQSYEYEEFSYGQQPATGSRQHPQAVRNQKIPSQQTPDSPGGSYSRTSHIRTGQPEEYPPQYYEEYERGPMQIQELQGSIGSNNPRYQYSAQEKRQGDQLYSLSDEFSPQRQPKGVISKRQQKVVRGSMPVGQYEGVEGEQGMYTPEGQTRQPVDMGKSTPAKEQVPYYKRQEYVPSTLQSTHGLGGKATDSQDSPVFPVKSKRIDNPDAPDYNQFESTSTYMQTGREESPDRNIPRPSNPEYISQESRQPQGKRRYYYNDDPREFRASPQPESHYEAIHQPGHVRRVSAPSEMYEDKQLYYKVYHPAYTEYVPYRPTRYFERPGERYYYEEYRGEPAFEQTGGYFVPSPRTESPEMRSREAFYQQGKTGEYPQYIIDNLGQEQVVKALKLMGGFVEFLEERSPQFLNIRH